MSMYETGYSPKHYPHRAETGRHEDGVILQPFPSNVSRGSPPPPQPPVALALGGQVLSGWCI